MKIEALLVLAAMSASSHAQVLTDEYPITGLNKPKCHVASNTYGNAETGASYDNITSTFTKDQVCVAPVNNLQFDNTDNVWTNDLSAQNGGSWSDRIISTDLGLTLTTGGVTNSVALTPTHPDYYPGNLYDVSAGE